MLTVPLTMRRFPKGRSAGGRWSLLGDDLQKYMTAAGFNESAKSFVAKYFIEQGAKLP